jgi:hypothetical protein
MKKLNPDCIRINYRNDEKIKDFVNNTAIKSKFINNSNDEIDSRELIDRIVSCDNIAIVTESIMSEISRLFVKCYNKAKVDIYQLELPTSTSMKTIEECVSIIVKNRTSTSNDILYLIRYKIIFILDLNSIDKKSKEALKVIDFVEYLIDKFTSVK